MIFKTVYERLAAVASLRNWGNSVQTLQVSFFVRNHVFIFVYIYHNNNYDLINGLLKSLKRKCCNMSEFFWRRKETQALQQLDQFMRKTSQGTVSLGLPCQLNTGAGVFLLGPPLNLLSLRGLIRLLSFSSAIHLWSFSSPKKDGKSSPSPVEKKRVTESDVHRKESFQKVLFQIVSNAARHNDLFFRDDATTKSNESCKVYHCVVLHIVPSNWTISYRVVSSIWR